MTQLCSAADDVALPTCRLYRLRTQDMACLARCFGRGQVDLEPATAPPEPPAPTPVLTHAALAKQSHRTPAKGTEAQQTDYARFRCKLAGATGSWACRLAYCAECLLGHLQGARFVRWVWVALHPCDHGRPADVDPPCAWVATDTRDLIQGCHSDLGTGTYEARTRRLPAGTCTRLPLILFHNYGTIPPRSW